MAAGRDNKLAGQIAEHLVCAELGRRGLIATPFAGNVPQFDLVAADGKCRTVPIQVKATRGASWPTDARTWMKLRYDPATGIQNYEGPSALTNPELIWVCVALRALDAQLPDRFFILTAADVQSACIASYTTWMGPKGWRRPRNQESYDCRFEIDHLTGFEGNWGLIGQRLTPVVT